MGFQSRMCWLTGGLARAALNCSDGGQLADLGMPLAIPPDE
jgi:hypothetical protein